jgi:hypothetical protein
MLRPYAGVNAPGRGLRRRGHAASIGREVNVFNRLTEPRPNDDITPECRPVIYQPARPISAQPSHQAYRTGYDRFDGPLLQRGHKPTALYMRREVEAL